MITFDGVEVTYEGAAQPTLTGVDLRIGEGELCVVIGPTGSGKSTLLGAVNGHVPHFTGGRLSGRVQVAGRDTADNPPRDLADVVGVVGQDPLNGFVTETVEEELAFSMEQIGLPAAVMRTRVEETLDLLGIADLRHEPLRSLSGGQQQRVAIGAALTAHPAVLVLDEPTSALDPTAAEEVLAAIMRLVHDLGVTAVVAEHRLERILQYADRVIEVHCDGTVTSGRPGEVMPDAAVAPPVVRLGRVMDWAPLPMSVRDARRLSPALRDRLVDVAPPPATSPSPVAPDAPGSDLSGADDHRPPALIARSVSVRFGDVVAVRAVDLTLDAGCVVALMGRNGAGKSSLLWALQGTGRRDVGQVDVGGVDPSTLKPADARRAVGLVPQTAGDLLYHATVADECAQADRDADVPAGACRMLLDDLVPGMSDDSHPRDLSEGQRLALALAVQLLARPAVLLLDEPTRGLDNGAKDSLTRIIRRLAAEGLALVISSHDVEFVANTADRVVVMAQGDIVANGPTADVVVASPTFAPQVAKVLGLPGWLTVSQVRHAVEHTRRQVRRTG